MHCYDDGILHAGRPRKTRNPDLFNYESYPVYDESITTRKLANGAVTTDKLADDAVTADKLANDAVTTDKIIDDAITTDKLADNVVITDKLANGAVTPDKLADAVRKGYVRSFETVSDMQAATDLKAGMTCHTNGFHTSGDDGAAYYTVGASGTANGMDVLALQGGLFATLVITEPYVTPEQFGAWGDGTHDDTAMVRAALKRTIDSDMTFSVYGQYYVTEPLLTSDDYVSAKVNIEGRRPLQSGTYSADGWGGIKFADGLNVFDGLTLSGSIIKVAFFPINRTQTGSVFHNCSLEGLVFDSCSVSNVLAFCHNTRTASLTKIRNSQFLTVYYFAKCDTQKGFTDSAIEGNYINGGVELNNNHCFEWVSYNGSTITNNFIDYYQTIYYPIADTTAVFEGCISSNNQYQVFRYLYVRPSSISSIFFSSVSDCFNWNDPSSLQKLSSYDVDTYVGHDENTHDIPPYIMCIEGRCCVKFTNPIIQSHCKNLVFVRGVLTGYKYAAASMTGLSSVDIDKYSYSTAVTEVDAVFNRGSYNTNLIDIPFIKSLDSLPSVTAHWNTYYVGERVMVGKVIYRLVSVYNESTDDYTYEWRDVTALQ